MHFLDAKASTINTRWRALVLMECSVYDATNGMEKAPFIGYLDKNTTDVHIDSEYKVYISMNGGFYKVIEAIDGAVIVKKVNRSTINIKGTYNYMLS